MLAVSMISVFSGGVAVAGGVTAAASGWSSPSGIAAFGTFLIGAGTFLWSIYDHNRKRHEIDLDAARELWKLFKEASDDDEE